MDKYKKSDIKLPAALDDRPNFLYNSRINREKICNVVKIHHYKEDSNSYLTVNTRTNSIVLNSHASNPSYFSQKVQRTFLVDSILTQETVFEDLFVSVIKRVVENENSLIVSVNRGSRKSAKSWNRNCLETLATWLYGHLNILEEKENLKFSIRISGLEIDEENDILTDLGNPTYGVDSSDDLQSIDNAFCRRCNDVNSALAFFNEYFNNESLKNDKNRKHILYSFYLYQQTSLKSPAYSVSSNCSKIFLLNLDLTKLRNQQNSMSLPLLSKFITSHINKSPNKMNDENNFQRIFSEIFQKNIVSYSFITQISGKDKKFSDTHHLLQLSGRIQRLKVKLKKSWDFIERNSNDNHRDSYRKLGRYNFRASGKFSDSEITSNSEISCAETIICLREEKRGNSDNESLISRRLRSAFISSDSDSGCKDLRLSQSSYSRDGTPVNFTKRKVHPRTNALVWPKSAIRMAKTTMMNGQELWVDGPNVTQKVEKTPDKPNPSTSTTSTPETVKQVLSMGCKSSKAKMISQETQYEYQKLNSSDSKTDFHALTDIIENNDEIDLLKCPNEFLGFRDIRFNSLNNRAAQVKPNCPPEQPNSINHLSPKNDVKKVSRWIDDVNLLTTSQLLQSKSCHEHGFLRTQISPATNTLISSHNYQYYDAESQDDYSSYPRLYSPLKQIYPAIKNDSKQISYINEDDGKNLTISDKKLFNRYKKKEVPETKNISKLRSFMDKSPLGKLKKTFFQNKSGKKKLEISETVNDNNCILSNNSEIKYLVPTMPVEDSSDSSSDSECNEWFRNIKTFKSKLDATANKCSTLRPPSAPLLVGSGSVLNPQSSTRQRSSSSGYGSVVTKDSEISSHVDSNSDQSIHSASKPVIKQSISFTHARTHVPTTSELDPDFIAERCESLVKQEKAILLMQHQEFMIQDFYNNTRPLLTTDETKYTLRMSTVNYDRLLFDNQYLEELEEDTNIIRDSIAFYKSLIHLESSFLSSPERHRKKLN